MYQAESRALAAETQITERAALLLQAWQERDLKTIEVRQRELANSEALVELAKWKLEQEGFIRQDAIRRSTGVILGQITEHFAPYLPEFPFNPKDARFLGSPLDFVVFDGLSEGVIRSIAFVEVKTGASDLTTRERRIRDAVQSGLVQWMVIRLPIQPTKGSKDAHEAATIDVAREEILVECQACGYLNASDEDSCAECNAVVNS